MLTARLELQNPCLARSTEGVANSHGYSLCKLQTECQCRFRVLARRSYDFTEQGEISYPGAIPALDV